MRAEHVFKGHRPVTLGTSPVSARVGRWVLGLSVGRCVGLGVVEVKVGLGVVGFKVGLGVVGFKVGLGVVGFKVGLGVVGFKVGCRVVGGGDVGAGAGVLGALRIVTPGAMIIRLSVGGVPRLIIVLP